MRAVDPTIRVYACGAPVFWGKSWNDALIGGASMLLQTTTDHSLIGGDVAPETDPMDVYRDFMAVPQVLEQKWAALRLDMEEAGIRDPRLAITELQLFAHLGRPSNPGAPARLTQETLVSPGTLAEAIYDVLVYHTAIRLAPFIDLVTHSATVNHGGGLRKERERVYANPCHYAQAVFADFAGATPVVSEVQAAFEPAPLVLPDLRKVTKECRYSVIDALAAVAPTGDLLLSIVHRGSRGAVHLEVELSGFTPTAPAALRSTKGQVN